MIYKHSQTLIKGAVIFLVAPFILISQSTAAVATVASPTLTGGSEGVNSAVLVSGSPISENATVADSTTVLLSASTLLTPGQETRTLSMEFDSKTVYTLNSAQAPEGWTLNYLTPSESTTTQPGTNNTLLSQNRAKAVAKLLRSLLPGQKIVTGWYASSKPVATGTSKAALAQNRRVEIYVK